MTQDIDSIMQLVPSYQEWDVIPGPKDWKGYWSYIARVDHAVCLLPILWPHFIEHDGLVLRKDQIPDDWNAYRDMANEAQWSPSTIEYVVNHVHVADLFLNDPDRDKMPAAVFSWIAHYIAEMWTCRLQQLFPEKTFVVGVASEEEEDPEVYAYTDPDAS